MPVENKRKGAEVMNGGYNGRLAEKLRSEYRNRGASLSGVQASSTSELMRRAQMGRDPKVNVAEEAFGDRLRRREANRAGGGRGVSGDGRTASAYGKSGAQGRSPFGADGRKTAGNMYASAGDAKGQRRGQQDRRGQKTIPGSEPRRVRYTVRDEEEDVFEEIKVARKKLPVGFLALLAFCTVMIMMILMSVAQIYQTTREISDLEDNVIMLRETIDDLELKLDEKNDIRLIEQMATAELGMVKEDSLRKKYISLSDGERVDLVGVEENSERSGGSTMLSSLFEIFGGFFEYFK